MEMTLEIRVGLEKDMSTNVEMDLYSQICNVLIWLSFITPILITIGGIIILKKCTFSKKLTIIGSFASAIFIFITLVWTSILFRDGLAPSLITSNGYEAIKRVIKYFDYNGLIVVIILFIIGIVTLVKRNKVSGDDKNIMN